ncbi:DUF4166 domain-containing protein [Rhodanobacter ginsengiterrae]|uniref:DUF4166 domain-containing protein n=1 Tax=Rhodanobacter ginsengiterrae TaxID=2008451 RepID=UPI003CFBAAFE
MPAAAELTQTAASRWFGDAFFQLHPRLQSLHRRGGLLRGPVDICFGRGLAGMIGRRLARRLGIPAMPGKHQLEVAISHHDDLLHWDRRFDGGERFPSTFLPVGRWPAGSWVEQTAVIALQLQVDIVDGGWHWRCVGARRGRWRLPRWLLPRSEAYKRIEEGRYRFKVSFALPLLGMVLGYGGWLDEVPGG